MSYTYKYPRPALTVDCAVFGLHGDDLKILLIQRAHAPYEGQWALPGGFVDMEETIEDAARRELAEETSLEDIYLEQLYTFGAVDRDPRERVVSVAWYALVNIDDHSVQAQTDARDIGWFLVRDMPPLAFDHEVILSAALERLRGKVRYQPIGFELLPEKFTLRRLQHLYEVLLQQELDKRNFRKKVLKLGLLEELEEWEQGVPRRPARLYRFDRDKYRELETEGFEFQL